MISLSFHVSAWSAWSPQRPNRAAWLASAGLDAVSAPEASPPSLLRRRVTQIGQHALRQGWILPDSQQARIVWASRDGELSRTVSLLDTLDTSELVSPTEFSLSVHHALAGLLSIARDNQAGHGAVAAGRDSLWCGVVEAACCLAEPDTKTSLLIYHNEPLAAPLNVFDTAEQETIALALVLTRPSGGIGLRLTGMSRDTGATHPDPHPCPGEALMGTLLHGQSATVVGERQIWHLERTDAVA